HQRAHIIPATHNALQVTFTFDVEHAQRHAIVSTQHDRGRIHDGQAPVDDLVIGQVGVAPGVRVGHRVRVVYAIHLGRLEHEIGIDFDRTQTGGGVGGKKRVAGAGREYHHTTLFQVPYGAAANIVLAHLVDTNGRHDPG